MALPPQQRVRTQNSKMVNKERKPKLMKKESKYGLAQSGYLVVATTELVISEGETSKTLCLSP